MRIHEYSYKPQPPIFARASQDLPCTEAGSLFVGVELEVWLPASRGACDRRLDDLTFPMCQRSSPTPSRLFYPKADSSIEATNHEDGRGVELVSHPFGYHVYMRTYRDELTTFLQSLTAQGFETNKSTGLHVHVSRKAFINTNHSLNFLNLFYRYPTFTYRLSGRASKALVDTWAKLDVRGEEVLAEKAERTQDSDRRTAVNMTANTAEIRIFGASLDPAQFHARIQTAFAAVRYAQDCNTLAHAVPLRWRLWVREHAADYPDLALFFADPKQGWVEDDNRWLRAHPELFPTLFASLDP